MDEIKRLLAELTSGDEERAEAALKGFAGLGPKGVQVLQELLDDENADKRWWAVRALAEIRDADVSEGLRRGLRDKESFVQQCAAIALRERPHATAIPELVKLLGSEDRMLAHLAADALIAAGKAATAALLEVVEKGEQPARLEAVRALASIGDTDSVAALFKLLDSDSALMEYWANEGLEKMGIGMAFFNPD